MSIARFGAVFDLNGVIINDGRLHDAAWLQVVNKGRAVKWTVADLHRIAGHSTKSLVKSLCPEATSEAATLAIATEKDRVYEALLRHQLLVGPEELKIPGSCELIGELHAESNSLALNTSSPANQVEMILGAFGLLPCFSVVLTQEDVQNPKPHPEGYLLAAQGLGLDPQECAGFEDSLPGLNSLDLAKYRVIVAVGSLWPEEHIRASGLRIDRYIADFSGFTRNELSRLVAFHA